MKLVIACWLLLAGLSLVVLAQTFRLQIVQGKEQIQRAAQNRFQIKSIPAQRGLIYDQKGTVLVDNEKSGRTYLYSEEMAHVLGYVSEVSEEELGLFGVDLGKVVGKMGLEREEDGLLRGVDGGVVEECSATGKKIRTFSQTDPIAGRNIQLSLDHQLQQLAFQTLKKTGFNGVVIISSLDGQILTLANFPSFDPNLFSQNQKDKNEQINQIFDDPNKPMFNRAIAGVYPPGSTFKIVTALGALEEGAVDKNWEIEDTGEIKVGKFRYGNWYFDSYGQTDGMVNMVKGLQRSNDIYFYKIGEKLGIEQMATWSKNLGLGQKTQIPLSGEVIGLVPTPEWKKQNLKEDWYLGDTYITAIGQGNLQTTPLQIHNLMSLVANDGYLCQPSLVAAVVDEPDKNLDVINFEKNRCQKLDLNSDHLATVKQGLIKACEPKGTGWPLFRFKVQNDKLEVDGENFIKDASASANLIQVPVACKTGTAETGFLDDEGKYFKTHAWFTAFAPAQDPEIVVTVLLEEAGQGSDMAAPIARDILRLWFEEVRD